ncbi:MAG TPA: flagellar biosynthesis regulator FlaF [Micropepsaceae bacterium]|jgi:flagellar protein FlaF|nr:flagellar biosynthesis regulator FlaF [Micropepsaceae bacterium]
MTLRAYQKAQAAGETPRNAEYRLFGQVTGALIEAQSAGVKGKPLVEAIDWNRRLWSTLAVDCMDEGNRLPKELRAQIVSLSLWVSKYSSEVMRDGATLEPLIDINRTIMQGLQPAA